MVAWCEEDKVKQKDRDKHITQREETLKHPDRLLDRIVLIKLYRLGFCPVGFLKPLDTISNSHSTTILKDQFLRDKHYAFYK